MTDFFCSLANTNLVHSCSQFRFILVTVVRLTCEGKGCKGGGAGGVPPGRSAAHNSRTPGAVSEYNTCRKSPVEEFLSKKFILHRVGMQYIETEIPHGE